MARKKAAKAKAAPTNLRVKSLAADKARGVRGGGGEPPIKFTLTDILVSNFKPHGKI